MPEAGAHVPLKDEDARQLIVSDLASTLFVEAGAGSGKTTALVNRLLALLAAGLPVQSIAAITFTEAAAAELKDRVRGTLEKTVEDNGAERAGWAVEALDGLDAAAIQTIHGFAQRILALHPLEAGLPPRFEVRDEVQAAIAFDERWNAIVDDLLSDPSLEQHITAVLAFDLGLDGLRDIAVELHRNWDRLRDQGGAPGPLPVINSARFARRYRELAARRNEALDQSDRMAAYLAGLGDYASSFERATTIPDVVRALGRSPSSPAQRGRQDNWPSGVLSEVQGDVSAVIADQQELARETAGIALDAVTARLEQHLIEYAGDRRRGGVLEFHDLLVRARDLLLASPAVRGELSERFQRILVDEFQDTDPLQVEIVQAIANGAGDPKARPPDGRLFFVGDPKQSIYRFRRADLEVYQRARERLASRAVPLTTNFRSAASILAWVNHVFRDVMGEAEGPGSPAYVPLDERPGLPREDLPAVHVLGEPSPERAPAVRDAEAADLALAIRAIKAQGWPISAGSGPPRPAQYQDVAILVRTRTNLPALEGALEELEVPYRVESRSLLFNTQEVRDLISILAAIDDPTDQVALVAALRSPAFACGDDDLLAFATAGGHWDYLSPLPASLATDHPVVGAMAGLAGWHRDRWWLSIGEIVDRVIRERRLFELAFAHRRPQERWQRYRFVQGHARAFAGQPGASLRRFVAWLRRQAEEGAMVAESPVSDPDDDAVRIMTVHAAKGLEFPIVCLAGLGTALVDRPGRVLWDPAGRPVARISRALEGARFASLHMDEQQMEAFELHRLLYVAATRARDHLVVSLHSRELKTGSALPAQLIFEASRSAPHLWRKFVTPAELPVEAPPLPRAFHDSPALRDSWLEELSRVRQRAAHPVSVAATTIARTIAGTTLEERDEKSEPSEDEPSWRKGRAGTSVGRAVHAVLQGIDLATGAGLAEAAVAQAAAEGIPGRQEEVFRLALAALAAPSVREAVSGGKFWRELFVAVPAGEQLLEGFIDLLYERPGGGLVVIDYKTDAVGTEAEIDQKRARYRLQAAAYALALERSLGRPVTACRFVFLTHSRPIEREVDDLRAAIAEVEAFLSSPAS